MAENQRYPTPSARALVDEMDADPVQHHAVLVEAVQLALGRLKVESVRPASEQPLQISQISALLPGSTRRRIGPSALRGSGPAGAIARSPKLTENGSACSPGILILVPTILSCVIAPRHLIPELSRPCSARMSHSRVAKGSGMKSVWLPENSASGLPSSSARAWA